MIGYQMFTRDGYINCQKLTSGIPFGRLSSDKNGCGWIATYNVLRHLENPPPTPEEVARGMRCGLILGGLLGTWPFFIMKFLRRRGYRVAWSLRRGRQSRLMCDSDATVMLYLGPFLRPRRFRAHYVMLHSLGGDQVRIFNFKLGDEVMDCLSLLKGFDRSTITLVMGIRRQKKPLLAQGLDETVSV